MRAALLLGDRRSPAMRRAQIADLAEQRRGCAAPSAIRRRAGAAPPGSSSAAAGEQRCGGQGARAGSRGRRADPAGRGRYRRRAGADRDRRAPARTRSARGSPTQQGPIARLLAALQSLARRPAMLAVAQPGSVDDLVHVRAVLGSVTAGDRARTAAIRAELGADPRSCAPAPRSRSRAWRQPRPRSRRSARARPARGEHRHAVARARARRAGRIGSRDRAGRSGARHRRPDGRAGRGGATGDDLAALPGPAAAPAAPGEGPSPLGLAGWSPPTRPIACRWPGRSSPGWARFPTPACARAA